MDDLASLQRRAQGELANARVPLFLQSRGSVWSSTQKPIAAFSLYALGIWVLNSMGLAPNFGRGASSLTSILSMIVGLMISYRSGSSSDRWHEGRRIWASVTSSLRVLITTLHLSLPPPSMRAQTASEHQASVDQLLALCAAYAYALKNHLRDQDALRDPAFCALVPQAILSACAATPASQRTVPLQGVDEAEKFNRIRNDEDEDIGARPKKVGATISGGPRNMPLYILRQIHSMLNSFHTTSAPSAGAPGGDSPLLETATWATSLGILKEMTDQLSQAERIRDTPIPIALGIHVQQMLVLYCLSIPPQLVEMLGLWVVPVSAVVAWTFWGVDSAAAQLSDPFGTDSNDLPVDRFVKNIHAEYLEVVGTGITSGSNANDDLLTLPSGIGSRPKGE